MEFKNFYYLLLLLVFLIIPLILSTRNKVPFASMLKYLLPATIFSAIIFGMWDIRFTEVKIWTFNQKYTMGIELLKIPIEEWFSFFIIPLSSAYIYKWLDVRLPKLTFANVFVLVSLLIFILSATLAYYFRNSMFTFFIFFLTAIYLGYTLFRNRFKRHYIKFYFTYFISLVPFILALTFQDTLPLVIFDAKHIIGINLLGIPIEKFAYLYLMLLMNITIYEYLNERRYY